MFIERMNLLVVFETANQTRIIHSMPSLLLVDAWMINRSYVVVVVVAVVVTVRDVREN